MPSFFSKVFGRKKDEKEPGAARRRRSASASLLEGKYEAVSPNTSPTADKFNEFGQQQAKDKEKDTGFSLFRPRSSTVSPHPDGNKPSPRTPHLELNLTVPKEPKSRPLGVVFEAADERSTLSEAVIGDRRLSPLETFLLVRSCATAMVDRGGLETLGVMHPHWYSASPEVQRRLISLFIHSLASSSPITTLSPTPSPSSLIFDSELSYTRSPHDIAAILRWALRHLRLEGPSFGSTSDDEDIWRWYTSFTEAERSTSYPTNAFSQSLVPSLPPSHLQLLTATLDIISSLAAHAETNGSSGSKLTKFFGLWLLTSERAVDDDDWTAFYARWERAGRILEHAFLSYIREEAEKKKMPLRLSELVKQYPYTTGKEQVDDGLLPRPRFSTRRYDTLFVRLSTELPSIKTPKPRQHPLKLIGQAFNAEVTASGDYNELWDEIKKVATSSSDNTPVEKKADSPDAYPALSRIFDDDTLRLLSLIPFESDATTKSITLATPVPHDTRPVRRRSTSLGPPIKTNGAAMANGKSHPTASPSSPTSVPLPSSPTDWADFSTAGFGEVTLGKGLALTLLDSEDVEVTAPPPSGSPRRRGSGKKRKATSSPPTSRRSSVDSPRSQRPADTSIDVLKNAKTQTSEIKLIKLDEAFIDFWSDALADPIVTSNWPTFVLCQLKANLPIGTAAADGKLINWLVIEHAFTYPPPPPPPPVPEPASPTSWKRPSSPRPSVQSNLSSRKSSTFSSRPRFSFFNSSSEGRSTVSPTGTPKTGFSLKSPGARKRAAKAPRVGEMGEILTEIEENPKLVVTENALGLGISGSGLGKKAQTSSAVDETTAIGRPEPIEQSTSLVETQTPVTPATATEEKGESIPTTESSAITQLEVAADAQVTPGDAAQIEQPSVAADDHSAVRPTTPTAPAATTAESTLSPIPVVDTYSAPIPEAPAVIEPIKLDEGTSEKPTVAQPNTITYHTGTTDVTAEENGTLPPAPEHVVLTGNTPGPEVALNTSEPAVLAEVAVPEVKGAHVDPQQNEQEARSTTPAQHDPDPDAVNEPTRDTSSAEPASSVSLPSTHIDTTSAPEITIDCPSVTEEAVKDDLAGSAEPPSDVPESAPIVDVAIPAQPASDESNFMFSGAWRIANLLTQNAQQAQRITDKVGEG